MGVLSIFHIFLWYFNFYRGLTKEGSVDGIKFLFDIKWELIFEANTWYVATN